MINLQDAFLNQARKENIGVTIYLMNGFQLRGSVVGFDNFTVILDSNGKHQLIYKHAISTIAPERDLMINYVLEGKKEIAHEGKKELEHENKKEITQ